MPVLALAAWVGGLVGGWAPLPVLAALAAVLVGALVGVLLALRGRVPALALRTAAGLAVVLAAVACVAAGRQDQLRANPVAALAHDRAAVTVVATVSSDPRRIEGRFGALFLVRLEVRQVTG